MRYGHFERIEINLRALAPVFIASGEELSKKEYIFDRSNSMLHVPDLPKLIAFLSENSLIHVYEDFLLHPGKNDLYMFLNENGIRKEKYPAFVSYSIDAGEVASSEHFRSVLTFIKGSDGLPYIPGSSLKGAIRTAIAAKLLKKYSYESKAADIERAAGDPENSRKYLSREANSLENHIFCRLGFADPKNPDRVRWDSIVNDFMRGLSISDSTPIGLENLTICGKYDRKPDGTTKSLPIYRECLAPGTRTKFVMTLDRLLLGKVGIDLKFIEDALHSFADMHYEKFEQRFSELPEDACIKADNGVDIILGGGSGYVSKTLVYPLIGERKRAVKLVSKMMIKQFRNHKHEKDEGLYGISPRTLKTTRYKGAYYQMGRCELVFK